MCRSKYGETVLVKSHCSILLVVVVAVAVALGVDASPVMLVAVRLAFVVSRAFKEFVGLHYALLLVRLPLASPLLDFSMRE